MSKNNKVYEPAKQPLNEQLYNDLVAAGHAEAYAFGIATWQPRFTPKPKVERRAIDRASDGVRIGNAERGFKHIPTVWPEYKADRVGEYDMTKWSDAMKDGACLINGSVHWPMRDKGHYHGSIATLDNGTETYIFDMRGSQTVREIVQHFGPDAFDETGVN